MDIYLQSRRYECCGLEVLLFAKIPQSCSRHCYLHNLTQLQRPVCSLVHAGLYVHWCMLDDVAMMNVRPTCALWPPEAKERTHNTYKLFVVDCLGNLKRDNTTVINPWSMTPQGRGGNIRENVDPHFNLFFVYSSSLPKYILKSCLKSHGARYLVISQRVSRALTAASHVLAFYPSFHICFYGLSSLFCSWSVILLGALKWERKCCM